MFHKIALRRPDREHRARRLRHDLFSVGPAKRAPDPAAIARRDRDQIDLVSTPNPTPLIVAAQRRGLAASGGLSMLVEQAASSFPLGVNGIRSSTTNALGTM